MKGKEAREYLEKKYDEIIDHYPLLRDRVEFKDPEGGRNHLINLALARNEELEATLQNMQFDLAEGIERARG